MSSSRLPSSRPSARPQHRIAVENQMIRRREKEFKHDQTWNGQVRYYKSFEKANSKYEEWTSPRYYESNNRLHDEIRKKRDKELNLEMRREKLKKLLEEEAKSYEIELIMKRAQEKHTSKAHKADEIPTELLKNVNLGLKLEEEERRRHEAEIKLYHSWRNNNPTIREYERCKRTKDLKLSWLDQQIEKRMQREKKEEECKRRLEERKKRIEEERLEEERLKSEREERNKLLTEQIDRQVEILKLKQKESEELRKQEAQQMEDSRRLSELQEMQEKEQKRREQRECALYNIKQHKMRLKQKARDIEENLKNEISLLERITEANLTDLLENEVKKAHLKQTLEEFKRIAQDQRELEKRRQKYFDSIFDSEAKEICIQQEDVWNKEEESRQKLFKDVFDTIKKQIEEKQTKTKNKQKELIEEREKMAKLIEELDNEKERLKMEAQTSKDSTRENLDKQIEEKKLRQLQRKCEEEKSIERQLERIRKEEERLKEEILRIQRNQPTYKPSGRSRIFL